MKLKNEFITHETNGEHITVTAGNTSFNGIIRSNQTAGFVIDCLREDTTEEEIAKKMFDEYDAPMEVISADVKKVIDKLRSIGAIDE